MTMSVTDSWGTETDYETGLDYESYEHEPYITLITQIKQLYINNNVLVM